MTRSISLPPRPDRTLPDETLPADQLTTLRRLLEQQRSFRIDQLGQLRAGASRGLLRGVDREINDSLAAGARAALRDVIDALHRMDAGTYGCCTRCQDALPTERLEIVPQVRLCLPCQRASDA